MKYDFVTIWESSIKNPERLYLDYLLINITGCLLESTIHKGYHRDDFLKDLLDRLRNTLQDDSIVSKVLREILPVSIKELANLVAKRNYDKNKINNLLKALDTSLKANEFIVKVKERLMTDSMSIDDYHLVISNLMSIVIVLILLDQSLNSNSNKQFSKLEEWLVHSVQQP